MGMMRSESSGSLRSDLHFHVLLCLTWAGFFVLDSCEGRAGVVHEFLFAMGAGAVSFVTLKLLGYFDPLRLLPRKSDVLLALFAVPFGGVAQYALTILLAGAPTCSLLRILTWTPMLALFLFGSHYLLIWGLLQQGWRRRVVLDLLPSQKAVLLEVFGDLGLDRHLELLTVQDLRKLMLEGRPQEVSLIIISKEAVGQFDADGVLIRAHLCGLPILDHRVVVSRLQGKIAIGDGDLWSYLMEATPQTRLMRTLFVTKRIFEPIVAVILAVLFSPVMAAAALAIRLTSNGPVLYRQVRTGYLGKPFTLIKFRSMYDNCETDGPRWATDNDERLTPVGRFFRKTRLDELPQLWNVFRGEMSFFGPRPERPEIYARLRDEIPLFSMRTIVRPGITGWAQVCAGYAASVEESKLKLEFDLFYIQNMSPRLDFIILFKTALVAVFGDVRLERERDAVVAKVVGG